MVGGLLITALLAEDQAQVVERERLAPLIANIMQQLEGLPRVADGVRVAALPPQNETEIAERPPLAVTVAEIAVDG